MARLSLTTEEGDNEGPGWMIISLRDGKGTAAWLPIFAPTIDAEEVQLSDGRLTGQITDRSIAQTPGTQFVYTIDATIDGDQITGTWQRTVKKSEVPERHPWLTFLEPASGALTGKLQTGYELKAKQAYAADAD